MDEYIKEWRVVKDLQLDFRDDSIQIGKTSNLYAISYKTTIRRGFVRRKEINSLIQDSFNFVTNKYSVSRRKFMHDS